MSNNNKCEICNVNDHKYKCPRCSLKTCSLQCCNQHKSNFNCDGQRDKTKFVNKTEFDEQTILSDYKFLEEQARIIDLHQRGVYDKEQADVKTTNSMQENLRKFVNAQFGIDLKLMPFQSTRHLYNKTLFNRAANTVSWSLEMVFHLNTNDLFRFNTKSKLYSSNQPLRSILIKFYKDFKSELFENTRAKDIKYRNLYEKFDKCFDKENFDDINVLFQITNINLKQKYYVKFDLEQNLETLLSRRSFIEYPTLFIVKTNDLDNYEIEKMEESDHSLIIDTEAEETAISEREDIPTNLVIKPINNVESNELIVKEKQNNLVDLEDGECDDDSDENVEKDIEYKDSKRTINEDLNSCKKLKN